MGVNDLRYPYLPSGSLKRWDGTSSSLRVVWVHVPVQLEIMDPFCSAGHDA